MTTPIIAVKNLTSQGVVDGGDDEVRAWCRAVSRQIRSDVSPMWGTNAEVYFYTRDRSIPPDYWRIYVQDDLDISGALGYHDDNPNEAPVGYIGAAIDKRYGLSQSVTFSHEAVEMVGDPFVRWGTQWSDTRWLAQELCDAVEADELGYEIELPTYGPVLVSDFVTPWWFEPEADGPYDFLGHLTGPGSLAPGGYFSYWDVDGGWQQSEALQSDKPSRILTAHRITKRTRTLGAAQRLGRASAR